MFSEKIDLSKGVDDEEIKTIFKGIRNIGMTDGRKGSTDVNISALFKLSVEKLK